MKKINVNACTISSMEALVQLPNLDLGAVELIHRRVVKKAPFKNGKELLRFLTEWCCLYDFEEEDTANEFLTGIFFGEIEERSLSHEGFVEYYYSQILQQNHKDFIVTEITLDFQIVGGDTLSFALEVDKNSVAVPQKSDGDGDINIANDSPEFRECVEARNQQVSNDFVQKFTKNADSQSEAKTKTPIPKEAIIAETFNEMHKYFIPTVFYCIRSACAGFIGRIARAYGMLNMHKEENRKLLIQLGMKVEFDDFLVRIYSYWQFALDAVKNPTAIRFDEIMQFLQDLYRLLQTGIDEDGVYIPAIDTFPGAWRKHNNQEFDLGKVPQDTCLQEIGIEGGWIVQNVLYADRYVTDETLDEEMEKWKDQGKIGDPPQIGKQAVYPNYSMLVEPMSIEQMRLILPYDRPPSKHLRTLAWKLNEWVNNQLRSAPTKVRVDTQDVSILSYDIDQSEEFVFQRELSYRKHVKQVRQFFMKRIRSEIIRLKKSTGMLFSVREIFHAFMWYEMKDRYNGRKMKAALMSPPLFLELLIISQKKDELFMHPERIQNGMHVNMYSRGTVYNLVEVRTLWGDPDDEDKSSYLKRLKPIWDDLEHREMLNFIPIPNYKYRNRIGPAVIVQAGRDIQPNKIQHEQIDTTENVLGILFDTWPFKGFHFVDLSFTPGKKGGGTFSIEFTEEG